MVVGGLIKAGKAQSWRQDVKQGLDLIEPAAELGFGDIARRPRGPQTHGHGAMVNLWLEKWLITETESRVNMNGLLESLMILGVIWIMTHDTWIMIMSHEL